MTFTQPKRAGRLPRHQLPTMYDLPSEFPEESGLPDIFHDLQPELLSSTLKLQDYNSDNCFVGSDLNVYYDLNNPLWHKRPDWFLAIGVPFQYENRDLRLSYVTWQEDANPFLVVELISPSTADEDFGRTVAQPGGPPTKWTVYEQILQIPYYVVFDRYSDRLRAFKLEGKQYDEQPLSENKLWIPELRVGLGLWQGVYKQGTVQETEERLWLRWYDENEQWLLTDAEKMSALKARLMEQGLDPNDFI